MDAARFPSWPTCEIGWTSDAEVPTGAELKVLLQGVGAYQGTGTLLQQRGLGDAVEKRMPLVPKTVPKKTPVKPVIPKQAVNKPTTQKTKPPMANTKKPVTGKKGLVC